MGKFCVGPDVASREEVPGQLNWKVVPWEICLKAQQKYFIRGILKQIKTKLY